MSSNKVNEQDSAFHFFELVQSICPECITVLTSKSVDDVNEGIYSLIEKAARTLESNKRLFNPLNENGLTGIIITSLSTFGIEASPQTHTNGHVDITIKAKNSNFSYFILGEAKIHHGPKRHVDGLTQLFIRYMTGREPTGFMISYFKQDKIKSCIESIISHMETEKPHDLQGSISKWRGNWAFISKHIHPTGESIPIFHIGCNLFI